MGKQGIGRNNQLSENGLLKDSDGNLFDLTEWYKNQSYMVSGSNTVKATNPTNALLQEMIEEIKDLNHTIKQIHNIEV